MLVFVAQAATPSPDILSPLLQFGAVGVIAALALIAVRVLFAQEQKAHEASQARADRLEEELRKQNQDMIELVIPALTKSTDATSEAMRILNLFKDRHVS
jgi:type VI protein secretion system component VasK